MMLRKCTYSGIVCLVILSLALTLGMASCSKSQGTRGEILIALKPEVISLLSKPEDPDPANTGIPALDSLNYKWNVRQMTRVFPDISPDDEVAARQGLTGIYKLVVPKGTDLATMLRDYEADPHIDYAELNQPYEIK